MGSRPTPFDRALAWVREIPIATAMRRTIASGYSAQTFRADAMAGAVVGIVALPLSMALALAIGAPPQNGLYTAIVAGIVIALTGGSKFQVAGPTAAFVVILAPIVGRYGLSGLLTAGLFAGVILIALGIARMGRLIEFIPHPVTTGFTSGIAVVIATLQIKDALGLSIAHMPDSYPEKIRALIDARHTASWAELAVTLTTLGLLIWLPRVTRKIPAPLIAITAVTVLVSAIHFFARGFTVRTVPPIPRHLPAPSLPWGSHGLSFASIAELMWSALAIALLGAIESLLSAVIADGATGKRHDPDAELVGQGIGNLVVPFFGGIAATGALARTALNIRSGARSPIASVVHSLVVLTSMLVLAPLVSYVPMASLAALLFMVAWNMSEARHFAHIVRVAPRSDVFVLIACFVLTVMFDMVKAVVFGTIVAALLFMKRMAELTQSRVVLALPDASDTPRELPPGVALYDIQGTLFFGAAQRAMSSLEALNDDVRVVIVNLGHVPAIDASGLVALESALSRLHAAKKFVIIAGPLPEPHDMFKRAQIEKRMQHVLFADDVKQATQMASDLALLNPAWRNAARAGVSGAHPSS